MVKAVEVNEGFFKICPECLGVLWTQHAEELARKRAEEAKQRKVANEAAAATRKQRLLDLPDQ